MRCFRTFGTLATLGLMALASSVVFTPRALAVVGGCVSDADCDDGRACNGVETCITSQEALAGGLGTCQPGDFTDCDNSGVADACEIEDGLVEDCDANGVPDSCDIADGATDCNGNGIPDVCDLTGRSIDQALANLENGVGSDVSSLIPSPFTFSGGDSSDNDFCGGINNNILDGGNDMYDCGNYLSTNLASRFAYTDGNLVSSDAIFGPGSSYHTSKFPALFVMQADNISIDMFEITGDNGADGSGSQDSAMFDVTVAGQQSTVYVKRVFNASDPSINHIIIVPGDGSGITHTFATNTNDDRDTLTGLSGINHITYLLVARSSGQRLSDADILALVDEFETNAGLGIGDCNGNGIPDDCDIANSTSRDVDSNGTPDECQPDCNNNNIPDRFEIRTEQAPDCNGNRIPDECDIEDGTSNDCNANNIPDECNDGPDCNRNGILDECDFASGLSMDCNANNIPDECDIIGGGESVVYFIFESGDTVYRLEDKNGDGDANDEGEGWAYGTIDGVEGIDVDQRNGDLYTAEEGNELIYRYRDLNGDGDALDEGEKFLYADDGDVDEDSIENIAVDESTNTIYTVYEDEDLIVWHRDMNGDGDALDEGEYGNFARIGDDLEEITVDARNGDVYVGDAEDDDVFRLNSNGDNLGSIGQLGHEALDFSEGTGELFAGDEDFDHIHRWVDGVENRYAELSCCAEALAVNPINGTLFSGDEPSFEELTLAGRSRGVIWKFVDLNGDGDALDEGERTLYHDFIHREENENETEGLAVFGRPVSSSNDENGNGVPDECENRGGGGPVLNGRGFTDPNGFYTATSTTAEQQPLARVIVNQAPAGEEVTWGVDPVQLDGPPGPGTGTFSGFANDQALGRTLTVVTTAAPGTMNVTVEIIFTQAELNTAGFAPEDIQIQVLDETATPPVWGPAGTNNVGEGMPTGVVGDFGFFRDNAARVVFWVIRDELSIYAVGAPQPAPAQEPPAPQPTPEPAPEQPVPSDTDGDGVTDDVDQCPNTAAGVTVDAMGCEVVMTPPDNTNDMMSQCGDGVCGTMGGAAMWVMLLGLAGMRTGLRRRRMLR